MTSPISSPQNIFAIERMSMDGDAPSWLVWFAVALPVAVIGNVICWALILAVYQPHLHIKEVGRPPHALRGGESSWGSYEARPPGARLLRGRRSFPTGPPLPAPRSSCVASKLAGLPPAPTLPTAPRRSGP